MKKSNITNKSLSLFLKTIKGFLLAALLIFTVSFISCSEDQQSESFLTVRGYNCKDFASYLDHLKDIKQLDEKGTSKLYAAASLGDKDKVALILKRLRPEDEDKKFANSCHQRTGYTPLGIAIEKGHLGVVKVLSENTLIDINKACTRQASLQLALTIPFRGPLGHTKDIIRHLMNCRKIAIFKLGGVNLDPSPLQQAIARDFNSLVEFNSIACSIIDRLPNQHPELSSTDRLDLLRVKNKNQETPLYAAAEIVIRGLNTPKAVVKKILWDRYSVVRKLAEQFSDLKDLCVSDSKKRTILHRFARTNAFKGWKIIFDRIVNLSGKEKAVAILFDKDVNGYTVFASSYLAQHAKQKYFHTNDLKTFGKILLVVKDILTPEQRKQIIAEIDNLAYCKAIGPSYVKELRDKIDSIMDPSKSTKIIGCC